MSQEFERDMRVIRKNLYDGLYEMREDIRNGTLVSKDWFKILTGMPIVEPKGRLFGARSKQFPV